MHEQQTQISKTQATQQLTMTPQRRRRTSLSYHQNHKNNTTILSTQTQILALLISLLLQTIVVEVRCDSQASNSQQHHLLQVPQSADTNNGECGASHPCQNGGTCIESSNNFTCSCPKGFTGPYCNEDVNECYANANICKNGATCHNQFGSYQCICVNGWTGHDCSENVNDCANDPCGSGGKCHDYVGYFYCECLPGKKGLLCQLDDGCYPKNPCFNGGKCDSSPIDGRAKCTCPLGYTGELCEIDINECAIGGSPCEHGGVCVNTPGSFRCDCPRGFEGDRCEKNIDECAAHPCENGATCLDQRGGYECICQPGYTGARCEIDIDECASNPCQNGARCNQNSKQPNSYTCTCQDGKFWGPRCEYSTNSSLEYISLCKGCEEVAKDGKCDQECNTRTCNYDGGDCALGAGNPWSRCLNYQLCFPLFRDGRCDEDCNIAECLYDGGDCTPRRTISTNKSFQPVSISNNTPAPERTCDEKSDYCLKNYANNLCDDDCNTEECGWDGGDCELSINDVRSIVSTEAQGLLVITVEPAIKIAKDTVDVSQNIDLARMLTRVSAVTKTILKIQNLRQVDEGRGTMIELIADNRKCESSCYNNTALIAAFLSALRSTDKGDILAPKTNELKITDIGYSNRSDALEQSMSASSLYMIMLGSLATVSVLLMVISAGSKKTQKSILWLPEGFKLNPRIKDPSGASRKVSGRHHANALYAIGGRLLGRNRIKSERHPHSISIDPNGVYPTTEIDRTTTPNGGGIYHEVDEAYDYGTQDHGSEMEYVSNPLTPPMMRQDPANIEGPHGMTPLMVASIRPPKDHLELISYGTTGEVNGSADNSVTDLLQRGAQLSSANKVTGETALHLAARHRRVDTARALLERCDSRDVNAKDGTGRTPLHHAIAADSMGVFELLIRCRGTDLNAQDNDGTTPLILAVKHSNSSMIEELIQNECEVTRSDTNGKTALHWAAATGNVDAIKCLLSVKETNKDAQDALGATPLFLAAREGTKPAVELLLKYNANKDINDEMDVSPIDIARDRQHYDIVRLLEDHDPLTPKSVGSIHHPSSRQMTPQTPRSVTSVHQSSRQLTPFSPGAGAGAPDKFSYNVPSLKNYITPLPDSPFSLESMSSPPEHTIVGAYNEQQYQIPPNHQNSLPNQSGVFV